MMSLLPFLALTFGISLAGFLLIVLVPGARSPESVRGLPFWLLMVWGPSLAAIIASFQNGQLASLLWRSVQISTIPIEIWGLVLAPILILLVLRPHAPEKPTSISLSAIAVSIGFNLVLGPLGEELGWRGVMQEQLNVHMGWLEASLLIGIIWLVWHLPLWTIESPHAQIRLHLFCIHCMLYSILIGAVYTLSGGSILSAILAHLTVNLAANWAIFAGYRDPNVWFRTSVWLFAALAACAAIIIFLKTGETGIGLLDLTN
jgi:membrane protease YdiL (CAAX protease family)